MIVRQKTWQSPGVTLRPPLHSNLRHFPTLSVLRRHPSPSRQQFDGLLTIAQAVGVELDVGNSKKLADSLDRATREDEPYFNKLLRILSTRWANPIRRQLRLTSWLRHHGPAKHRVVVGRHLRIFATWRSPHSLRCRADVGWGSLFNRYPIKPLGSACSCELALWLVRLAQFVHMFFFSTADRKEYTSRKAWENVAFVVVPGVWWRRSTSAQGNRPRKSGTTTGSQRRSTRISRVPSAGTPTSAYTGYLAQRLEWRRCQHSSWTR